MWTSVYVRIGWDIAQEIKVIRMIPVKAKH